jgi:hypothetical protein
MNVLEGLDGCDSSKGILSERVKRGGQLHLRTPWDWWKPAARFWFYQKPVHIHPSTFDIIQTQTTKRHVSLSLLLSFSLTCTRL